MLGVALCLGAVCGGGYVLPHLFKSLQIRELRQLCRETGTLVLTYDDGPGPCLTPRVLDRLGASNARATFFMLGERVEAAPGIVERVIEAGHEVGCHTQSHWHPWKSWPWSAVADVNRGYETLRRWISPDAPFRPPYGKLILPTWLELRRRGSLLGWWTVGSGDTHTELPSPESIRERVRRDGGGVVLLHDFDRSSRNASERAEFVLEVTDLLLKMAVEEKLTIRPMGELLQMRGRHADLRG